MMAFVPSWTVQLVGRLIAGAGGIVFNVVISKMTADPSKSSASEFSAASLRAPRTEICKSLSALSLTKSV
jgi:hypothetical protein